MRALLTALNQWLHPGTACPGDGAYGECPAMDFYIQGDEQVWSAEIYLRPAGDHISGRAIAQWFKDHGCTDVSVAHVLEDDDESVRYGRTLENERWLTVTFVKPPPASQV